MQNPHRRLPNLRRRPIRPLRPHHRRAHQLILPLRRHPPINRPPQPHPLPQPYPYNPRHLIVIIRSLPRRLRNRAHRRRRHRIMILLRYLARRSRAPEVHAHPPMDRDLLRDCPVPLRSLGLQPRMIRMQM